MAAESPFGPEPTTIASATGKNADPARVPEPGAVGRENRPPKDFTRRDDERIGKTEHLVARAEHGRLASDLLSYGLDPDRHIGEMPLKFLRGGASGSVRHDKNFGKRARRDHHLVRSGLSEPCDRARVARVG